MLPRYKQAYLNAKKEDITIMHSPVGMPGRAIRNPMIPFMTEDIYQNLVKSIDASAPESIHLCDFPEVHENWIDPKMEEDMADLLEIVVMGRADGDTDNALLFCGENAWRLDHMTTVPELMAELAGEYLPDSKK